MKRKLNILLMSLLLASCSNKTNDLTILCPTGAPSLAFYNYADSDNFTSNSSPANIVSSMTSNGSDIIVIDTIKGVSAINNGAPYKLAANITFGNFYIVATGNDDNNVMDKDDVIVNFGFSQTPQKIFELIYGSDYSNISYVENVSMAAKCLQTKMTLDGKTSVDYVFIAEPALTQSLTVNKDATIYANIQEEYKKITGEGLIQAGIFVNNSLGERTVNSFLKSIESDITKLVDDSSKLDETLQKVKEEDFVTKYGIKQQIAKKCINNNNSIGLGFKKASDNKEAIEKFLNLFNLTINEKDIF